MNEIDLSNSEFYQKVLEPAVEETEDSFGFEIKVRGYDLTSTLDDPGNEELRMFILSSGDIDSENDIALNDWDDFIFGGESREGFRKFLLELLDRSDYGNGDHVVEIPPTFSTDNSLIIMVLEVK